jgi:streptogramin lyase
LTFDKDNTCWISTYKGLVSYDGVKWESYPQVKGDKPVIDKNDFLWIYGSGKFTCYDGTRWSVFPIINGQVTNPDSVTFSSFQGKLWIQASSDLASFDGTTWTVYKCGVDLPFKSFNSFAEDPNGNLWFATSQGIYEWILNPEPVNVKEDEPELAPLVLNGNYPNPFNAETTIKYTLYKPAKIKIEIYNVAGQRVQTLDSGMQDIGAHEIVWDSRAFSSGIYFYKLLSGNEINIGRMMLMK